VIERLDQPQLGLWREQTNDAGDEQPMAGNWVWKIAQQAWHRGWQIDHIQRAAGAESRRWAVSIGHVECPAAWVSQQALEQRVQRPGVVAADPGGVSVEQIGERRGCVENRNLDVDRADLWRLECGRQIELPGLWAIRVGRWRRGRRPAARSSADDVF